MVQALATSNSFHQIKSTLEKSDPTIISTQNKKPACRSTTNYPRSPSRHDTILVKEEKDKEAEVQCEEKYERQDRIETKEGSFENSWYDEEIKECAEPFYIGFKGNRYSNNFDGRQQEQDDREDDMDQFGPYQASEYDMYCDMY